MLNIFVFCKVNVTPKLWLNWISVRTHQSSNIKPQDVCHDRLFWRNDGDDTLPLSVCLNLIFSTACIPCLVIFYIKFLSTETVEIFTDMPNQIKSNINPAACIILGNEELGDYLEVTFFAITVT